MENEKISDEFWIRADEIIELANKQIIIAPIENVSSSILYAAARFNTFNIGTFSKNVKEMKKDKTKAIEYFTDQYRKMLTENIDEYIDNYKLHRAE
jgi:hypothetical protein